LRVPIRKAGEPAPSGATIVSYKPVTDRRSGGRVRMRPGSAPTAGLQDFLIRSKRESRRTAELRREYPVRPAEMAWGARPPRAQFSAPSRKTRAHRKRPSPVAYRSHRKPGAGRTRPRPGGRAPPAQLISFICPGVTSQARVAHLPARSFSISSLARPPFFRLNPPPPWPITR